MRCKSSIYTTYEHTLIDSIKTNNTIYSKDKSKNWIEGGTNCIQSKWLALCKKPAQRRPLSNNFRAARQGLCDAPPPRVTLSWPATCWILLLRYESPSFERPSSKDLQATFYRLPSTLHSRKYVLNVLSIGNATTPIIECNNM